MLLWGDPAFAGGYGKSSMFAGSDGVEWCEPQSFKGRMGTGIPGQRFTYQKHGLPTRQDWMKYAYQYRVWGRLLYNPDAPRDSWMRWLETECGDAAEPCEQGLALASRVLPLVTLTHGPSASNNHYWPEIYTNLGLIEGSGRRAYAFDMEGTVRFGNAPTFDSALFATAREYAELLLAGKPCHRYTPLDVADWLQSLAQGCETALTHARSAADFGRPEVQRITADVQILAGIARYFAERFRAACWAELFVATKVSALIEPAIDHAKRAVLAWEGAAAVSRDLYADDITYGPQSWLRGSWHSRLPEMQAEILDLESLRGGGKTESVQPDAATNAAVAALRARQADRRGRRRAARDRLPLHGGQAAAPSTCMRTPTPSRPCTTGTSTRPSAGSRCRCSGTATAIAAEIPADYTKSDFHLQLLHDLRPRRPLGHRAGARRRSGERTLRHRATRISRNASGEAPSGEIPDLPSPGRDPNRVPGAPPRLHRHAHPARRPGYRRARRHGHDRAAATCSASGWA